MSKEIYISTTPHETRLAIVEDEQLTEIYYERENEYTLAGSIYNGKVTRVLPGMQSAFVDVGLERDAFLYVTDFMEEQGDAADFESESGSRRQPSRENGNSSHHSARRGRNDDASAETETTMSFDEPVAPSPPEEVDSIEAGSGSRRWRGRRGRRYGRAVRDERSGTSSLVNGTSFAEEDAVIEGGYVEEVEASSAAIEIDLDAEIPAPPLREEGGDRKSRTRFGARDRGSRGGRDDRSRGYDRTAPRYDNSYAGYGTVDDQPEFTGEPIVLPGESIRKYRDPAEVAAEDSRAQANAPVAQNIIAVTMPSFEVIGWDGGAVLPGESLSRRTRSSSALSTQKSFVKSQAETIPLTESFDQPHSIEQDDDFSKMAPTPVESLEDFPAAEAPEDPSGLTEHPAHGILVEESTDIPATGVGASAEEPVAAPSTVNYEPEEGASVSVNTGSRQNLRRYEQVAEPEALCVPGTAAQELAGGTPDQTTYDLSAPAGDMAGHGASAHSAEPNSTELQPSGEMLSVSQEIAHESAPLTPQDTADAFLPMTQESAVQSVTLVEAESVPVTAEYVDESDDEVLPAIHAYGDGDLQEEEIEGDLDGDEDEYEAALSSMDEGESDEYEEELLEDSGPGFLTREASLEKVIPEQEVDDEAALQDEVSEDTDEDDVQEEAQAKTTQSGEPERRTRRPANGRERRNGGDRGRGRRPSVQATDLPAINELLKPGQEILVQIAKEPIAKKGARITSHIALPGRFLVFMPTVNHTGVSRKISSDEERRRLKSILLSEKGDAQGGFIVRTAAATATEEELRNDLRFLIHLWNDIKARSESSKSPALIYHDLNLVERILRDQVTDNFSAIWVDTEQEYERVLRFLQRFQPALIRRVKLYTKETPLFEHFSVTQEIDKALKSKVWLKSGGSIVINQTEALVAIDINTGKYVGKTARLEDTILKTNLDAIPEIVRQIRLRDLGGIIVIDFIDMDERKNRAKVLQALEDAMRTDRAPSKILPFNDFGLVIMTRKRVKQSLERTLCIPDPITEGTGMIKSPVTIANEIYVEMRKMYRHLEKADVLLRVHPEVVKTLKSNGGRRLQELEEMTHKTILVKSDPALSPEAFDIA